MWLHFFPFSSGLLLTFFSSLVLSQRLHSMAPIEHVAFLFINCRSCAVENEDNFYIFLEVHFHIRTSACCFLFSFCFNFCHDVIFSSYAYIAPKQPRHEFSKRFFGWYLIFLILNRYLFNFYWLLLNVNTK